MQNSSAFQYLALDTVHESTTNPRRTFDEAKLHELAESIRQHGLIQPITVRPNPRSGPDSFEIVAGARRFRAAQLADLFAIPARIVDLGDAQALEWQLVENAMREDVHPYEEAQGLQRLLDMPGYDIAALVEKTGKSASHVYARLSLLQLIPAVAEAFAEERITASHANLIARLPQETQAAAFEQCWRKDWQDREPHLLPAKHVAAWIQANLYLSLAEAPFDQEDPTLNPVAGACSACPRRTGYNTALFADAVSDECLDGSCYQTKIARHIDRAIAARPELVQIENGWRSPREQKPGTVQRGHFREIEPSPEAPEPATACDAAKPAIVVFGKRIGTTLTVCTGITCPVHNPSATAKAAAEEAVTVKTEPHAPEGQQDPPPEQQQRGKENQQEKEQHAEERRQQFEREQAEYDAEQTRRADLQKVRQASFERMIDNAPATLTAPQLRVLLRALVSLDPYTFADNLAQDIGADDDTDQRIPEEVLMDAIDATSDEKLTGFAVRLALAGHVSIPRDGEIDFLTEAAAVFAPPQPKKAARAKTRKPALVPKAAKTLPKQKNRKAA